MYSRTNRAALIAQIGAINRPKVTEGKSIDFSGAVDSFLKGREQAERRAKEQEQKNRVDAWINQLNGDETLSDTEKAYFTANPDAYGQRMANNLDFERQKELLGIKNQYDVDAAEKTAALAREIARIKAGGNGLVNINMNNPFDKKRIETIAKNMDENISTAQGVYDTYKQALDLLNAEDVKTGGAWNAARGASGKLAGSALLNSNEQRLNALINETIPKMRPVGSGSASDKDMETFAKATLGFGNTKDANKNIASGRMLAAENSMAMEELRAEYVTSGMGSVSDFDREWRRYLNANPIFNDKGGLNKSRVDAYSWFGGNQQSVDPKVQQALDAGYSMDEINAFLGR